MKRNVGFTLVELMVVIAIIAFLAAILLPVFARARERGRQSACSSNLRQIAICIQIYADEHDEEYPSDNDIWSELKISRRILSCPSVDTLTNTPSYSYSSFVAGKPISDVIEPTEEMLVVDGNGGSFRLPRDFEPRHNGGMLAAFCDSHVEFMKEPPPMWISHVTTLAEFHSEVEESRFPVVVAFIAQGGDSTAAQVNQYMLDNLKQIAKENRLKAKLALMKLSSPEELQVRQALGLSCEDYENSEDQTIYPMVVLFYKGSRMSVILPPADQTELSGDELLAWWQGNNMWLHAAITSSLNDLFAN